MTGLLCYTSAGRCDLTMDGTMGRDISDQLADMEARFKRLDEQGGWTGMKTSLSDGAPQLAGQLAHRCRGYPYVSNTLPQWAEGCDHTSEGKAIVQSRRHESSVCSQHGFTREYSDSDPIGSSENYSMAEPTRAKHEKWVD